MAISDYGTLKTQVANWLQRDDYGNRIPEFIALAEDHIAQTLRVADMQTTTSLTITTQTTSLPSDYLQQRRLYLSSAQGVRLDYYPPQDFWIRNAINETGQPKLYTIEGGNLVVAPTPDGTYTGAFLYYAKYAALSADSDTNWILSNASGLYLFGALMEAAMFHEDEAGTLQWAARYDDLLAKVHAADKRHQYPDGALIQKHDNQVVSLLRSQRL